MSSIPLGKGAGHPAKRDVEGLKQTIMVGGGLSFNLRAHSDDQCMFWQECELLYLQPFQTIALRTRVSEEGERRPPCRNGSDNCVLLVSP